MSTCGKMILSGKRRILVEAKEESLVPDLIESLRQEFPDVSLDIHDSAESFASASMTHDMFSGGWRIIVMWDLTDECVSQLDQIVGSETEDALIYIKRKAVSKTKLYTQLRTECEILTLEPLDEKACASYVGSLLKRFGCEYHQEVPSSIVSLVGKDLPALMCEAKKLSFLGKVLLKADVERVVRGRGSVKVFDFADAILRKRWVPACSMASSAAESDLIGLLHVIQTQCLKMYKAAMYKEQGMSSSDIATMLDVPAYVASTKIIPLASQLGRQRILRLLDLVNTADETARLSKLPKRLVMESLVIKMLKA